MLSFSKANAKLDQLHDVDELQYWLQDRRKVYSFDLISGWSCPQAKDCLSKVVQIGDKRKIQDGKDCQFRCFSASQEATFPNVYKKRKHNFDYMKSCSWSDEMVNEIVSAMPKNLGICRIHVAGDFFNQKYFRAWRQVARICPDRLFYAYTKSLSWWVEDRDSLPENFVLTASRGGRQDHLIDQYNLRESKVVFSEAEAEALGYEIDHTDEHAAIPEIRDESFALLIHGQQPKGSKASEAIKELKANNVKYSYSKKSTPKAGV
ncbi:MAG: hypothetical protein VW683_11505 [Betaproteobacteria bacterium]